MHTTTTNDMRTGDKWKAFLRRYRLRNIVDTPDGWAVDSDSGARYHVRSTADIERHSGSMVFRMSCDCPARQQCRHITAVLNMREAEARVTRDYDALEIIERSE